MAMINTQILFLGVGVASVIGYALGWRRARIASWRSGHVACQLLMKEKIRAEVNDNIAKNNLAVRFRDGSEISAEQMLQFMCYGAIPDIADPTKGKSTYNPG